MVDNNPITLQVLGICSALAVTTSLLPSLDDVPALTVVAGVVECLDQQHPQLLPTNIRIIVQMTIIASLVIVVDQVLKAYAFEPRSSCRCSSA